jgi:hypothetical protein
MARGTIGVPLALAHITFFSFLGGGCYAGQRERDYSTEYGSY